MILLHRKFLFFMVLMIVSMFTAMSHAAGPKLKRKQLSDNYMLYSDISEADQLKLKKHMRAVFKAFKKDLRFRDVAGRWNIRSGTTVVEQVLWNTRNRTEHGTEQGKGHLIAACDTENTKGLFPFKGIKCVPLKYPCYKVIYFGDICGTHGPRCPFA